MKVESDGLCWHSFGMFSLRYPESIWICLKIRGTKNVLASASSCNIYPLYQLQRYMMRFCISPCTFFMKMMLNTLQFLLILPYFTLFSATLHPVLWMTLPETDIAPKKMGWLEVWKFPFGKPYFQGAYAVSFKDCIWVFPKIVGFPPKSSNFNRDFHYKSSILGYSTPILGKHPYILPFNMNQPPPKKSNDLHTSDPP